MKTGVLEVRPVAAVLKIWLRSIRRFRLSCPVKHPPKVGADQPCNSFVTVGNIGFNSRNKLVTHAMLSTRQLLLPVPVQLRFSMSVEHLRQRFPQGTGSLLSLLARVPSRVLASLALCLASDFVRDRPLSLESTPSRIGSSAWFLSCLVWVSFLLSGAR